MGIYFGKATVVWQARRKRCLGVTSRFSRTRSCAPQGLATQPAASLHREERDRLPFDVFMLFIYFIYVCLDNIQIHKMYIIMYVTRKSNKKGSYFKGNARYSCMNESKQTQAHLALLRLSALVDGTHFLLIFNSIFNSLLISQQRVTNSRTTD